MSEIIQKSEIKSDFVQLFQSTDHFCENNFFRENYWKTLEICFLSLTPSDLPKHTQVQLV